MELIFVGLAVIAAVAFAGFLVLIFFARRRKSKRDHEYWQQVDAAAKKRLEHIMDQSE